MPEAFVTLATNDAYCMGCLVVGKCLRRHGTTRKLVAMVSSSVNKEARSSLKDVFDEVVEVDVLDSRDKAHLAWLGRPELGVTFSKLHCWTLTYYTKCVFLDADTLVLCNVDELFEREELSAAPDVGWPDCFNSGVFVFRPSLETHSRLLGHAIVHGSFDGGDQGLLNSFFSDWAIKDINKHLPFIYNLSASTLYTYLPAFHKYGHQAKIVHFLGGTKPWHLPYNQQLSNEDVNRTLGHYVNLWWAEYYTDPNVKTSNEQQDSVLFKHPLECPHTASHPQSQESDSHVQDGEDTSLEDKSLSQELDELTLSASVSNTSDQLEKERHPEPHSENEPDPESHPESEPDPESHPESEPDSEPVTTGHTKDFSPVEIQEFGQEEGISESETAEDSSPPPAVPESDTASGESSEESLEHRRRWEAGHIDYMGKDAFENIRRKLDQFLS